MRDSVFAKDLMYFYLLRASKDTGLEILEGVEL